jgi:enterochelin esterase family protein
MPEVSDDAVTWRLADADGRYSAVRLLSDAPLPQDGGGFARVDGAWELVTPLPSQARVEYRLEVTRAGDGASEAICDPDNPVRAPGAFGERSVLELPGYRRPWWLDAPAAGGVRLRLDVPSAALGATVEVTVWSPRDAGPDEPLPLLAVHDGPEYDRIGALTRYCAALIAAGRLPPHRVALLHPGLRDEWYAAHDGYARALAGDVLPAIATRAPVAGTPAGIGASLGGLAMLHAQRSHPGTLGALLLQSASFFLPRYDPQEARFSRFGRIARFVRDVVYAEDFEAPVPVTLTCGAGEENLQNNRRVAAALALQGYPTSFEALADLHNYTAWRDALDPCLTDLLRRAWAP